MRSLWLTVLPTSPLLKNFKYRLNVAVYVFRRYTVQIPDRSPFSWVNIQTPLHSGLLGFWSLSISCYFSHLTCPVPMDQSDASKFFLPRAETHTFSLFGITDDQQYPEAQQTYVNILWLFTQSFRSMSGYILMKCLGLFCDLPYFSVDNARVIYTKKLKFGKIRTCALYIRKRHEASKIQ
jgi:hypothetical protein